MRRFTAYGGSHDRQTVSIKHGREVLFASSGEKYRVLVEPSDYRTGALVPVDMPEDEARAMVANKRDFPFSR